MRVIQAYVLFCGGLTDNGNRAALTLADVLELRQVLWVHGDNIAFLRLVTPNLQWRHLTLGIRDIAQIKYTAAAAILDQFRKRVGQTTGTHIMDKGYGVLIP